MNQKLFSTHHKIRSKKDIVVVTPDILDIKTISDLVADPAAGAIATFVGVTRDNFNGKRVLKLEYEAYEPMAKLELNKICDQIRVKWDILHIAMYHRTGKQPT